MKVEVGGLSVDDDVEDRESGPESGEDLPESEEFDELEDEAELAPDSESDLDDESVPESGEFQPVSGEVETSPAALISLPVPEPTDRPRPAARRDCLKGGPNEQRPCPWSKCHHHLGFGRKATCTLDVADEGGVTLEEVGDLLGLTRERIRQLEFVALKKVRRRLQIVGITFEDFARDPSKMSKER